MKIFPSDNWPESSTGRSGILPGLAWAGKLAYQKIAGFAALIFLVASLIIVPFWQTGQAGPSLQPSSPSEPTQTLSPEKTGESFGQLPLSFESNQGQLDKQVRFQSQGSGYGFYLTAQEIVINLNKSAPQAKTDASLPLKGNLPERGNKEQGQSQTTSLHMKWLGGNPSPLVSGTEKQDGITNYLLGNDPSKWHTNIPNYGKVDYHEVYPGIDLTFYGNQRQLEYDFVVKPQASPDAIRLGFEGATSLEIDGEGNLIVHSTSGDLSQPAPKLYQEISGSRQSVSGRFKLVKQPGQEREVLGFEVGTYDTARPLVIDPSLGYSTYLGGSNFEVGDAIAVDSDGSAYIFGNTSSTNFPTTAGTYSPTLTGSSDAFITKLNPTGTALVYSTYLGGTGDDYSQKITLDSNRNVYLSGYTTSSDFPTTASAYQTTYGGGTYDGFVTKLNPGGTALVYSTYLGGSGYDLNQGMALDSSGDVYVSGSTSSTNFPTTSGVYKTTYGGGGNDAFITRLNPAGTALVYSTYLGGTGRESGFGIVLDASNNVYITGYTTSTDFPTTPGVFKTTYGGGTYDGFVARLNPAGTALVYSTYLGGAGDDFSLAVALDSAGNAYITGYTTSTNFPTTAGVFKTIHSVSVNDAFVTKVNPTGTSLVYSTFLGGGNSSTNTITVNSSGNAFVTGNTSDSSYTTTGGAFQTTYGGGTGDGIMAELNPTATALAYSTFLGGSMGDAIRGSTVDSSGNVYVTGDTDSTNFPTSSGAFNTTYNGGNDAFVSRIPTNSFKTCTVNNTSDNAATVGGFRNALSQSPRCDIINFNFASATTINITGSPLPNVPLGVTINGICNAGLPIITINGSGITGTGLYLSGGDTVNCLIIQGFSGAQLKAVGGAGAGENIILHVKASKS